MIKFLNLLFDNLMPVVEGVGELILDWGTATIQHGNAMWEWFDDDQAWPDGTAYAGPSGAGQGWPRHDDDMWRWSGVGQTWSTFTAFADLGYSDQTWLSSPSVNIDGSPMFGSVDIHGNPYGVTSWSSDSW